MIEILDCIRISVFPGVSEPRHFWHRTDWTEKHQSRGGCSLDRVSSEIAWPLSWDRRNLGTDTTGDVGALGCDVDKGLDGQTDS